MRECLVSIIVPVYNVESYLARCIESILCQTYQNIEVILINDGSTDKSGDICDAYAQKNQRIRVIHKENGGLSDARNKGLDLAKGEYITFVDSDDYIAVRFVERMYKTAVESRSDIIQCGFVKGTEDNYQFQYSDEVCTFDKHSVFEVRVVKIIACAKLYHRKLFEEIRFPKGKVHEDEFTTYRVLYKAAEITARREALYYYYQTDNSIMRGKKRISMDALDAMDERIRFFSDIGENRLADIARKERSLRLSILSARSRYHGDLKTARELYDMYLQDYHEVIKIKMPKKEKYAMIIFRYCPAIMTKILSK